MDDVYNPFTVHQSLFCYWKNKFYLIYSPQIRISAYHTDSLLYEPFKLLDSIHVYAFCRNQKN